MAVKKISIAGLNIKFVRQEHALSQEALAEKLNEERANIAQWERGKVEPDDDFIYRLCVTYGYNVEDFWTKMMDTESIETRKKIATLERKVAEINEKHQQQLDVYKEALEDKQKIIELLESLNTANNLQKENSEKSTDTPTPAHNDKP